jgi:hypothetical protein
MDYRLKSLYEQMLSGSPSKATSKELPKNLTEAYKVILNERTAFYAKDIAAGEEVPNIQGLENLGAVEEPQKIKHTIASLSVLPALEKAMSKEMSGWGAIKGVDMDRVAKDFIVAGVSGPDLEKITAHKKHLTAFQEAAQKTEVFNLINVITSDIKNKADIDADSEALSLIFKRLFEEEGTISGTAVGKGELAISLFTNCSKGKTGDLLLPSGKTVEVKGKGGRLGPAEYSQANTARDLVQFLKTRKTQANGNLNRELVRLKTSVRKFANDLEIGQETSQMYSKIFTDKLKQNLNKIADNIDNPKILDFAQNLGFKEIYRGGSASSEQVYKDFLKLGYITPKQQGIPAASIEKDYVKLIQSKIRKFLNDKIFEKGKIERITGKTIGVESLETQTFTTAVQDFFLNNLGLTPDEAAEAFLSTKSYNKDVSRHLPEIKSFFQQHYSKMIEGDVVYLQAAIFAFQLTLYAQAGEEGQHFDYFMIMNNSSMNALSLDVARENLFTYLANVFLANADKIDLSIRADGRQGASAVTLK